MESAGKRRSRPLMQIISIAFVVLAIVLAIVVARTIGSHPSSDDASLDADIVHVAAVVGGRIVRIAVRENDHVARGEVLFEIDPVPYRLAVAQAQADLDLAAAQLETQRRFVSTQRSNATIAGNHTSSARTNYELARRTADRLRPLTQEGYVPVQQLDQAEVTARDAATALTQAQVQHAASIEAIDSIAAGEAAVAARRAALALAQRNLEDTTITAPHDGLVVGLAVTTGEVVIPAQSLFTLIASEEWFAVANFRETDLDAIKPGACATVYSLIDRKRAMKGSVTGIGWGVASQDRINLPRALPYVERSLNWVRVAQRFPVRIRLEKADPNVLRLGASAVVEIDHGSACR